MSVYKEGFEENELINLQESIKQVKKCLNTDNYDVTLDNPDDIIQKEFLKNPRLRDYVIYLFKEKPDEFDIK